MLSMKHQDISLETQAPSFTPVRIVEIDLGHRSLPVLAATDAETGMAYRRALCVVRLHTYPIGTVELALDHAQLAPDEYLPLIWQALQEPITRHLQRDGLPVPSAGELSLLATEEQPRCLAARAQFLAHAPFVSVIVPTHDRPDRLALCLQSLSALEYPCYEIIVVDNAPSTSATYELVQQQQGSRPQVHYLREERKGASWARNCGMKVARGDILCFVDDDVVVDAHWLTEMVRAFSVAENVACVSGLVLPLKLDTPAQAWFEEYGGFQKGFERRIFDLEEHRLPMPLYPYNAGFLGVGASMAFRASVLRQIGGFDPALAGDGPARGGEDLAAFFQVITRGYTMIYEPAALLYHLHRQDYPGLLRQIHNYGIGQTAYLTRNLVTNPRLVFDFLSRIPYGLSFLLSNRSSKNAKKSASYPRELTRAELLGMLYGPLAYLQSRWRVHQLRQSSRQQNSVFIPSATEEV